MTIHTAPATALSPTPTPTTWAATLADVIAKGRTTARPGSLAGLAAARAVHHGQFFTPDAVAARLWQLVAPTLAHINLRRRATLLDTSIGSARLLQFADPMQATLTGCDIDANTVEIVSDAVRAAGFEADIVVAGLETCTPRHFDVALLNPPFSLTLQSPHLTPGATTTYGPFGPDTSTLSQWYALSQALDAAAVVAIIMPTQDVTAIVADPTARLGEPGRRLIAAYTLPANSFRTEGTDTATAIGIFGPETNTAAVCWTALAAAPNAITVPVFDVRAWESRHARLGAVDYAYDEPTIRQPVTGDDTATLHHDGRRLVITTRCGFTAARVQNAVLGDLLPPREHPATRLVRGVRADGHFRLDREILLAQPDWRAALAGLVARAATVGVTLDISSTVQQHLTRRARATRRQLAPFGRMIADVDGISAHAAPRPATLRRAILSNAKAWGAPAMPKGAAVIVTATTDGQFTLTATVGSLSLTIGETQLRRDVAFTDTPRDATLMGNAATPVRTGADGTPWREIESTFASRFPAETGWWRQRAIAAGVDRWLWDGYQFEDCIELLSKPQGAIAGWSTGLGKSRLAAALALVHGGTRTVVVVPSRLIQEMVTEWQQLPLPAGFFTVVRRVSEIDWAAPVLLIAAEHLRAPVGVGARRTLASVLRRRVSLLILDEADFLANPNSARSRAAWTISARKRILMTGTVVANYPRDAFPLLALAAGDGTAGQPAGWHRPACEAQAWQSALLARRGRDAIRDDFTTMQWVTPEFTDTLRDGAKREVPVIQNLPLYRSMLARVVKRRVHAEPDVARHVKIPAVVWDAPRVVAWDDAHLAHFLTVAEEFAAWYADYRKQRDGKASSLVTLLARIGAVERAGNDPMHATNDAWRYHAPTSKQRAVVEHLVDLAATGHRAICYARHPETLNWVHRALAARGVQTVVVHGQRTIADRLEDLDVQFRDGHAAHVLASFGTGDRGLNLPQADRIVLLDRDWSARTESQCVGRVLRPQQQGAPRVQPFHLPGSLDEYMAQMTAFKHDAAGAGVDWGTPTMLAEHFLHLDTVIFSFVESLATLRGLTRTALRPTLHAAAPHAPMLACA